MMTKHHGSEFLSSSFSSSQRDLQNDEDAAENDDKMQINKPSLVKVKAEQDWNKNEDKIISQEEQDSDSEQQHDYNEDEEPECGESEYWHIRGMRCVPVSCPGGNNWRDVHSGECILRKHRGSGKWRKKYSARFGVPSKTVSGLMNGRWVSG